jgi:hypothetical protein
MHDLAIKCYEILKSSLLLYLSTNQLSDVENLVSDLSAVTLKIKLRLRAASSCTATSSYPEFRGLARN